MIALIKSDAMMLLIHQRNATSKKEPPPISSNSLLLTKRCQLRSVILNLNVFHVRDRFCHEGAFLPEVVSLAKDQVCSRVETRANFSESTIATRTFETVFMPKLVHGLQKEPVKDSFMAT